ncbi:bacterial Ig-like domain-containing protein [Listeria ilorinensis]|uniref:bacterial Ig-like domain-containing protein n=1 Tax=Listeria ilorinensis TaxID=2867439 RepID=UPI001EF4561A|nr:bacterial Ig-like domain-containing protein [Listeria ilorinensis]
MVAFLLLGQLNLTSFRAFAEETGNEELSYAVQTDLSADKKKANVKIKVTPKQEQVKILSIETPDGQKIEGDEASYTADQNGTIQFLIAYQNEAETAAGQEPETKTYQASYEVSGISSEAAGKDKESANAEEDTQKDATSDAESATTTEQKQSVKGDNLKAGAPTVTLSIPDYNQTAWSNGDIKTVTATVQFNDNTSSGKKVKFTLPDGMRFTAVSVPSNYQPTSQVDTSILSYLGGSDPLSEAITSMTIPDKETTYNKATYGSVVYELDSGTEKASFNFSVRMDAAKYYGAADLKEPIKVEAFMGDEGTPVASDEQVIHAEGNKVVGYANQDHVKTMFRNWYVNLGLPEVLASTDTIDSYNYTKPYSVVNGLNELDNRGAKYYTPKNVQVTLYYPEGMEYVGVVNQSGVIQKNNSLQTITPYPEENKVVIDFKQENYQGSSGTIFTVKYKVPKGTPAGTYTAPKVPHAVITTYDGEIFESDALTTNTSNLTTLAALDTCKVVDTTTNQMYLTTGNGYINPDNETWAGSIRIDNQQTAGTKTNQMYHITFDSNWETYIVNLPFDGTLSNNQVTDVQYKTNLKPYYRTYSGEMPKTSNNRMAQLTAAKVGLEEGEYFTEVQANVGDFSPGFRNTKPDGIQEPSSTASYGIVKPGITSVDFIAEIWDAEDEANTKVAGKSVYTVNNTKTAGANGTASFYNTEGKQIKTARAGEKVTTKATLTLFEYPYGTRTVLNDPDVYLRELEGTKIHPSSIKLTDQNGKDVDFTVKEETAISGEKVYILQTSNTTVGRYVGYPSKSCYLNVSYDFTFDNTLSHNINTDAQQLIAWGGPDVASGRNANYFYDEGLDVNQNGKENEKLPSVNSSPLSVLKQDAVSVETFLNVEGEGVKSAYVEGDDSTVSYFTPGTDAEYTVKITNNSESSASTFELYVPIPKTGQNFGSKFQSEAFQWDMKMSGPIVLNAEQAAQFDVSYATTATEANYEEAEIYTAHPSDYEQVNMVRVKVKTQINSGETQTFKVPLKVDETFDTATAEGKIGERDIYNPFYRVETNTFSGTLPGTKVGAELVIAEVEGTLFNDQDVNGLYEQDKGDTPLANETVALYKWNETTSRYEPVVQDGTNVTTTTDAKGAYTFDYSVGLGYGQYAVRFPDKAGYQYTLQQVGKDSTIDSDADMLGSDRGWVKDIDPTLPTSQFINAGYFMYTPAQDLKVNLNEKMVQEGASLKVTLPKVASTSGQAAEDTIEPSFFQNIQASTDGYVWTTADTRVATVQTLSDGSGAIVGGSAGGKTVAATDLTLAIQDLFGTQKTSTAPVYVKTADGHVNQQAAFTLGASDFTLAYQEAKVLTDTQALALAKTAAFEEVKNGVNSTAQDRLNGVQVNATQLAAIQNGSNHGGTYPLTYTLTQDGQTVEVVVQVTVEQDLTDVNVHDSTIYVGDQWRAADNFDSALDQDGNPVALADVQVSGTVDSTTAGTYPVTYTYNGVSATATVTVKEVLTAVNAHDSVIYTGDSWEAADNFDSALDKDGNAVSLRDVQVTGTVDTTQAGAYPITYTYEGVPTTITVTVKENKAGISAHDSTIYVGDSWSAADNFDSAYDQDGNPVAFQDVKVTEKPTVDLNKAGAYQITYQYGSVSKTITLTVKEIQTAVNAHDSTIYTGDNWSAMDNFDSALDKDGNAVAFTDVQVTGTVDTTQAGTYPITYAYDGVSKTITVTVKEPLTAVYAHDSLIYAGDDWTAKDNFDSALDKDGNAVAFKDITVQENPTVDPETPGVYQVIYSYDGASTTINVTVAPRQTSVQAHDSTLYTGDKWVAKDNFDGATDKAGNPVDLADVQVTGTVDTQTPGTYEVTYTYDGVKAVAHITVLENQAQITVQDSTLTVGDEWEAQDNFISATNRDGQAIRFSNVTTKGTVDTTKPGTYSVTYTIDPNEGTADAGKEQLSVTAKIQVLAKEAGDTTGDSTGHDSKPSSNTDKASSLKVTSGTQHTATYEQAQPLPRTGDQNNLWIIWLGMGLLALSGLLWVSIRRRRRDQ